MQEGPSFPRVDGWLGRVGVGGYGWASCRDGTFSGMAFLYRHLWGRPGGPVGRSKTLLTPTGRLQKAPEDSWGQASVRGSQLASQPGRVSLGQTYTLTFRALFSCSLPWNGLRFTVDALFGIVSLKEPR